MSRPLSDPNTDDMPRGGWGGGTMPCPRCDRNPVRAEGEICEPCKAEEEAEAKAGEEDSKTQNQAKAEERRQDKGPPKGNGAPPKRPPASAPPKGGELPSKGQQTAPPASGKRMSLDNVQSKPGEALHKLIVYSPEGLGKTTLGMEAPSPIFLAPEWSSILEKSTVPRLPQPTSWAELLEGVDALGLGQHAYKTVVVDTLDRVEELAHARAIEEHNKQLPRGQGRAANIEEVGGGYGKGYVAAIQYLRAFLARLERLIATRRMNVILLAHGKVVTVKDPSVQGDYDQWDLALCTAKNGNAADLFRNWADTVLFGNFVTNVRVDRRNRSNRRADSPIEGGRQLFTQRTARYRAKNREGLPLSIDFSWQSYEQALRDAQDPRYLIEIINEKAAALGDASVGDWVATQLQTVPAEIPEARRTDWARWLSKINLKLGARLEEKAEAEEEAEGSDAAA